MEKNFLGTYPFDKRNNQKEKAPTEGESLDNNQDKINLLQQKIESIINKVNNLNPRKISPEWIKNNCQGEYDVIRKKLRTMEGEINWKLFADFLPEELKAIWHYERQRNWKKENPKETLVKILEKENPTTFNAYWIRKKDYGLYRHLRRKLKNKETGEIEWGKFINQLPAEWQEKWIVGFSEEEKIKIAERKRLYTFESAVKKLDEILERENPAHFSSKDLERFDKQLFSYFKENIKKEKGGIDWEKIMEKVEEKYAKRFRPPKKFEDEYPDNSYENKDEVDKLLDSNKEGILGFFEIKNKKERDVLCLELIKLAKKGNINAEKKIIDYMEILLVDIAEKDKLIRNYCDDPEKARERIRRCIYLYRENQPTSFVGYVYISLREEARPLAKKKIELDSYIDSNKSGSGMSKHETTDLNDYNSLLN